MTKIELKRSVWLMVLLLTMGLLAGMSIALAHLPVLIQLTLAASLLSPIIYYIWAMRKPLPDVRIKSDGQIQLSVADGEWQSAELMPGSFVSPGLSVVRLRTKSSMHRLTLMRDSATSDELRGLRLSLRWAPRTRLDTAFPDGG